MTTVNEEGKALVEQSTLIKSKALAEFYGVYPYVFNR